jgi:hypothetical protein
MTMCNIDTVQETFSGLLKDCPPGDTVWRPLYALIMAALFHHWRKVVLIFSVLITSYGGGGGGGYFARPAVQCGSP